MYCMYIYSCCSMLWNSCPPKKKRSDWEPSLLYSSTCNKIPVILPLSSLSLHPHLSDLALWFHHLQLREFYCYSLTSIKSKSFFNCCNSINFFLKSRCLFLKSLLKQFHCDLLYLIFSISEHIICLCWSEAVKVSKELKEILSKIPFRIL